ncbi:MAG TPA: metalloregulator ArsR/SmtB family transcription factor [Candidatus Binataceae bacterium]|nr:metalloregulator ArsR/SmtB family transcription factor [Candidatus Binataceae bacterium]
MRTAKSTGTEEGLAAEPLEFFRALADRSRLRIVGLLAAREYSVQELARTLGLREPTVSHHLAILKTVGLASVRSEGTTRWYRLEADALHRRSRALLSRPSLDQIAADTSAEAGEREVLANFLEGDRLTTIPVSRKKRWLILRWLAGKFSADVEYTEAQVNAIMKRHHEDAATLRREMVGCRMLARAGGVYRLLAESEWRPSP